MQEQALAPPPQTQKQEVQTATCFCQQCGPGGKELTRWKYQKHRDQQTNALLLALEAQAQAAGGPGPAVDNPPAGDGAVGDHDDPIGDRSSSGESDSDGEDRGTDDVERHGPGEPAAGDGQDDPEGLDLVRQAIAAHRHLPLQEVLERFYGVQQW